MTTHDRKTTSPGTSLLLLGLCAAGFLCAEPATAQKKRVKDAILRKDGKQLRNIEVLAMKVDKVTYKQRGKENVISSSQVESVKWDDPPEAFAKAQVANTLKRFDDAAQLYLTAAKDEKVREVIRLEAQFLAGRACLMAAGGNKTKADAAGKVVEDYVNAAPDGFHLPEAKLILGKVKILTGDAAGAEDLMAVVEADAGRGGWPDHWVAQAQFVKAQAQSAQGKHDDARNSYKMVVTTVGAALGQGPLHNKDLLLLQTEAKVMQGETFIQQKYYDDALAYFRALASSGGAGLKAAARTGEGQILYLQGRDKADVRVLRLAQLALAEAAMEADTNPSTSAKALFYMGKVLQALGDKEANGLARAKSYFQSVRISYPKTHWATLAKQELEG
ncbi:MAG: tetratricopeptide repeat protein [Planctomycetota bacterium]|jgi:TolA-binding protein